MTALARDEILARVRAATAGTAARPPAEHPPPRPSPLDQAGLVDRFVARCGEYRARVERLAEADLPSVIAERLVAAGVRRLVVPAALPTAWTAALGPGAGLAGVEVVVDDGLTNRQLDAVDAALTGASAAVAETGTLVLDGGPAQGRRALTLVPDTCVVVVRAIDVVADVPDLVERIDPDRPTTLISGPSATSDIELDRVEGVHGPRTLIVLVVT